MTTSPTTLTYDEVTEALNKRLERLGPDYVYERPGLSDACAYSTPDAEPSCAVGDVFYQLVPSLFNILHEREWTLTEDASPPELDSDGPYWTYGVDSVLAVYRDRVIVDTALRAALQMLQQWQDGGLPLEQAVRNFHQTYKLRA